MKNTPLISTFLMATALAACGASTDKEAIDRRAELEVIQNEMADVTGGEGGSYGKYLIFLSSKSEDLSSLAQLPTATLESEGDLAVRNLVVSISASALLADLPGANETIKTTIRNGVLSEERLKTLCEVNETADCALGKTLLNTIASRELATSALALSVSSDESPKLAETAMLTYSTFAGSLPDKVPEFAMDAPDAGAVTHYTIMRQQACTLSWAHSLLLPKIRPDSVMKVNAAFRDAMAKAFDQTKVNLCTGGAANCTETEIKCAKGEDTSTACLGKKTSAMLSSCGPVQSDLSAAVKTLVPDDQTGT